MAAVIIIRPRQGGAGFKYTIPMSALAKLGPMNKDLDPRGRYDAVMETEGLFQGRGWLHGYLISGLARDSRVLPPVRANRRPPLTNYYKKAAK